MNSIDRPELTINGIPETQYRTRVLALRQRMRDFYRNKSIRLLELKESEYGTAYNHPQWIERYILKKMLPVPISDESKPAIAECTVNTQRLDVQEVFLPVEQDDYSKLPPGYIDECEALGVEPMAPVLVAFDPQLMQMSLDARDAVLKKQESERVAAALNTSYTDGYVKGHIAGVKEGKKGEFDQGRNNGQLEILDRVYSYTYDTPWYKRVWHALRGDVARHVCYNHQKKVRTP